MRFCARAFLYTNCESSIGNEEEKSDSERPVKKEKMAVSAIRPQCRCALPDHGSNSYALMVHSVGLQAELIEVIRRRRVYNASDDEDLGLPRSPVSNSPTTADDMFTKVSYLMLYAILISV